MCTVLCSFNLSVGVYVNVYMCVCCVQYSVHLCIFISCSICIFVIMVCLCVHFILVHIESYLLLTMLPIA